MSNLWFEIAARVPPALVEAVSEEMRQVAPGGVSVVEPIEALGPELGFRVLEGEPVTVTAYLPSSELGAILTERLRQAMDAYPEVELIAKPVYQEDWEVSWREFFGPVAIGRVTIVPTWQDPPEDAGDVIIRLDPGMAFGTGHHETTRLCLGALQELVTEGCSVIDVGVGSGVLSIAATKLGAGSVAACDLDPLALTVTRENCAANGVEGVAMWKGSLTPEHEGRYDVVVANISRNANIGLAGAFAAVLAAEGELVLSGLLVTDVSQVTEAMVAVGLAPVAKESEGEWALLRFRHAS